MDPAAGIRGNQRGAATVEHAALVLLAALIAGAGIALARADGSGETTLGSRIAQKQRCAVRYPDPCWQDPLTEAYGRGLGGAIRALAPAPETRIAPGGEALVGVDFRRCRQVSCAVPLPGAAGSRLTASNRRTTAFTTVDERAPAQVTIDYWIYRPTIGWELVRRRAERSRLAAYERTPLLASADPALVPLETLLGRDDAGFRAGEEPPWRGRVESRWGR